MSGYNCVTLNSTGQILRIGSSDFENDGSFYVGTETYHTNLLNKLLPGIDLQYQKIVASTITEMSQGEKDIVDAVEIPLVNDFHYLKYPIGEQEELTLDGVVSLTSYTSSITAAALVLTLADGLTPFQTKRIQTQTGGCTVTCTLKSPTVSFTLGNNNKAELMWYVHSSGNHWRVIDSKGIVLNE